MSEYIVVYVTCKSKDEAFQITRTLAEKRLIACGNIVPLVESVFWWEGKVQIEQESLIIMKTKLSSFDAVKEAVKSVHSYTVPEIIAVPIKAGSREYLKWIEDEVTTS
jgi:periplasmic divalent cation tolerance protein